MHKDLGGPLVLGPIWDLNEAFGICCGYPIEGKCHLLLHGMQLMMIVKCAAMSKQTPCEALMISHSVLLLCRKRHNNLEGWLQPMIGLRLRRTFANFVRA